MTTVYLLLVTLNSLFLVH